MNNVCQTMCMHLKIKQCVYHHRFKTGLFIVSLNVKTVFNITLNKVFGEIIEL